MHCPRCNEEVLPGATICRFCGAAILYLDQVTLPATGATQRLPPLVFCPKCTTAMEEGFLFNVPRNVGVWWAAGAPPFSDAVPEVYDGLWRVYGVSIYRCTACGYLESYATKNVSDVP